MFINVKQKVIGFKIVYYGPAMGGKTTNIRHISENAKRIATDMLSLETRGERTLYFDMVRLAFGSIGDYKTYFHLYSTPGQMVYSTSRRLVLKGVDAIVFVVDSQQTRFRDNVQAWYAMERQLLELNLNKYEIPIMVQLNKRDMPYITPVDQLLNKLNAENFPHMEASAAQGEGVFETLEWVVTQLVDRANEAFKSSEPDTPTGAPTNA